MRAGRAARVALLILSVSAGGATSAAGGEHRIVIRAADYVPRQMTVRAGDTVEWVNEDIVAHTATDKARGWEVTVSPAETGRVTLQTPGTVDYFCSFHPNMTGTILVVP